MNYAITLIYSDRFSFIKPCCIKQDFFSVLALSKPSCYILAEKEAPYYSI